VAQQWADGLHRRIAAAIRNARGARSAQWLADETARFGYPISRAALANYESGRKKGLDVTELMTIAVALEVPPLVLLFPDLPDGAVEVMPKLPISSWDAAAWFSGEGPSPLHLGDDGGSSPVPRGFALIRAVRALQAQLASVGQFYDLIMQFAQGALPGQKRVHPGDPPMTLLKDQLTAASKEIKRLHAEILDKGGVINDGK